MKQVDIVVVGGGSAGMAAAVAAHDAGVENILIIERSDYLGGILRQCIHNGFGVHHFREDLTGVEYAKRYRDMVLERGIPHLLNTFVLEIGEDRTVTAMNPEEGLIEIQAGAVVLAMGCRERTRGQLLIPGARCAGVYTAGTAQKLLNIEGYLPGKRVVILGSGDIGLIMARQFAIEGAKVEAVVEIMPFSGGLARNIAQCLEDFDIPLYYNSTVADIRGRGRVESVVISRVDENRRPLPGTQWEISCDTLLLSAGLIPENELTREAGIQLSFATKGAVVADDLQTSRPGVFSCGNVLHVHDLVDHVSAEGEAAGRSAARFVTRRLAPWAEAECVPVRDGQGVGGTVPQLIRREGGDDPVRLMFRPRDIYKNCTVCVDVDGECRVRRRRLVLAPGEMSEIELDRALLASCREGVTVRVEVEQ